MKNTEPIIFQIDSDAVQDAYNKRDNFLIEETDGLDAEKYCCIYFSSNDIYFPNNETVFTQRITESNFFEWYGTRVRKANKHIFLRDVFKQWYLTGINREINSPERLLNFLKAETAGFKIITVGSSAGGYAAALYGWLLNAEYVLAFNAQFEIRSLLGSSTPEIDPLVFRNQHNELSRYFDLLNFSNSAVKVFYFYSNRSRIDLVQANHIGKSSSVQLIPFQTSHHGIPFLKCNLPIVINFSVAELEKMTKQSHHPLFFSIQCVGILKTISGLYAQVIKKIRLRLAS
jgi:hypothetical protein